MSVAIALTGARAVAAVPDSETDHVFLVCAVLHCALSSLSASAQTDEIQVYNADIAAPGVFNLTLHNNSTPVGQPWAAVESRVGFALTGASDHLVLKPILSRDLN